MGDDIEHNANRNLCTVLHRRRIPWQENACSLYRSHATFTVVDTTAGFYHAISIKTHQAASKNGLETYVSRLVIM